MRVPFSIDVTKGDAITPGAIDYELSSSFDEDCKLRVMAYPLETVLAEKCESILKRNVIGTRPRDYYDVYMLKHLKKCNMDVFRDALTATFDKCGTIELLSRANEILDQVSASSVQHDYWKRYQKEFPYAVNVDFISAVNAVRELLRGSATL